MRAARLPHAHFSSATPPNRWMPWGLPLVVLAIAYGLLGLTLTEQLSHQQIMQRCVLVDPNRARIWSVGNVEIGLAYFGVFFGMLYYFLKVYSRSLAHITDLCLALGYLLGSFALDFFCVQTFHPFVALLVGDAVVMTFTLLVSRQVWFQRLLGVFVPVIFLTCGVGHCLEGLSYWQLTYTVNTPWAMVTADIGFAVLVNAIRFPAFIRGEDVIAELALSKKRVEELQSEITARQQAETALQDSHRRLSNIMESISDAFLALDKDWHITPLRALMIKDSEDDLLLIQRELVRGGFDLTFRHVESAQEMQAALEEESWDVVLADYNLPGFGAPPALELLQASGRDIPFIIISGTIGEERAVEMMRAGAADYVMKSRLQRLVPAIRREIQDAAARREHRLAEAALQEQERENEAMHARFRDFLRDVLSSVTDGKLRLCYVPTDLPNAVAADCEPVPLSSADALRALRVSSQKAAQRLGFADDRWQDLDLVTAVSEAGMNAVVHAGGGEGHVCQGKDTVQVWIEDQGKGIAVEHLPRATLEKGFTTAGSLGFGMKMMLQTTDRVWLLTGLSGTTVVLEQDRIPSRPLWIP